MAVGDIVRVLLFVRSLVVDSWGRHDVCRRDFFMKQDRTGKSGCSCRSQCLASEIWGEVGAPELSIECFGCNEIH